MTSLTIDTNADVVLQRLAELTRKTSNLRPLFVAIGEDLAESTRQRFSTLTAPDGTKWAPNSQTTIDRFLRRFKTSFSKKRNKLTKTGAARAGSKTPLTGYSKSLRTTINYSASATGVSIGSPLIYASTQQFGARKNQFGKAPWGKIPARAFLGISAADAAQIDETISDYLALD